MNNFCEEVKAKLNNEFKPEDIVLIDNSHLHTRHKSFDAAKVHLKLIIKSKLLNNMKRTDAHKMIFSLLKEEMKNKIHALEIKIK